MFGTLFLNEDGYLEDGEHPAAWDLIAFTFGTGERRRLLLEGLLMLLRDLRAAGATEVWLDGSFVTDDPEPRDFDVCWSPTGTDKSKLPPEFGYSQATALDPTTSNHDLRKLKYRGDVFVHLRPVADFVAVFREDKEGRPRGIVKIDMKSVP